MKPHKHSENLPLFPLEKKATPPHALGGADVMLEREHRVPVQA